MEGPLHYGLQRLSNRIVRWRRRWSGIHGWLLLRFALVTTLSTGLGIALSGVLIQQQIRVGDAAPDDLKLNAAIEAVGRERQRLSATGLQLSGMESIRRHLASVDDRQLARTLETAAIGRSSVDFVGFQSVAGELVRTVDSHRGGSVCAACRMQVAAALGRLASTSSARASVLAWVDGRPAIVVRAPVTGVEGGAERIGWLVLGRFVDGEALGSLRREVGFPFRLLEVAAAGKREAGYSQSLGPASPYRLLTGEPVLLAIDPAADGTAAQTTLLLGFTALALGLLAAAVAMHLIEARVVARIRRFGSIARGASRHRQFAERWPDGQRDEIDALGGALNLLMEQFESSHRHLGDLAATDPLTGLGNRRRLLERIDALRRANPFALTDHVLALLDIDDFKLVNDGIGHDAGDHVLSEFGERIRRTAGRLDLPVRLGGDEFAVLLRGGREYAEAFCERLRASLALPVLFENRALVLSASIGLAEPRQAESDEEWVRNADTAMYQSKRAGKQRVTFFEDSMRVAAKRRVDLAQALRKAVEARTLETWYQPIVDGRDGAVTGVEALVRWRRGDRFVPPDEFIPVAEDSGLIVRVGQLVILHSCEMLARMREIHPALRCSINLSVQQFMEGDLARDLEAAIVGYGLPPEALTLEITESQVASQESTVLASMNALRERGFSFALDDFGVGFSSLDRLRRLPVSTLKIDRSFVSILSHQDDPIVRHIVALAHDLGLRTIAEGVEDDAARLRLLELGCRDMQGYLHAKPMPEGALRVWLQHRVVLDRRAA